MQQQKTTIRAAIDIGSNTIEVLIARCAPDNLEIIEHQSTLARLGESVDGKGKISRDKFKAALDAVGKYQKLAKKHEAREILAIATETLREVQNSQDFIEVVKHETGLEVQLISGYAEAVLDYFGATYSHDTPRDAGVLDVGGSSIEIVTANNRHITWLTSVSIGSGTIHDRYLHSNPPTHEEMESARSYLASQLPMMRIPESPALIVTGSSASSLLELAQHAFKLDEQSDQLTLEDLARCEGFLDALKAAEIAKRFEHRVERACILPAGALIIQAIMQHLHINEIYVSSHGVREGALLAYTRFGEYWLEEVNSISSKWGTPPLDQDSQDMQEVQKQPFMEFGRDILPKYAKTFLKWPDDVREQEDIEAVHKMSVASRRLRAALDAFEPCVDPSSFKMINRRVKKLADRLGTVRDTDAMVASLRSYLQPALVDSVLDPDITPSAEQRYGLEQLLHRQLQLREEHYRAFRQHWYPLQVRDFRRELQDVLKGVVDSCFSSSSSCSMFFTDSCGSTVFFNASTCGSVPFSRSGWTLRSSSTIVISLLIFSSRIRLTCRSSCVRRSVIMSCRF
jgi:exopolyphosphatase/pppGpp-phosphohydrolase